MPLTLRAPAPRDEPVMSALPVIVWEADPVTLRTTFVSPQSLALLGYSPEDWLADDEFWVAHVHDEDRAAATSANRAAAEMGTAIQAEYRFRSADGVYRWFQDTIQLVEDEAGRRLVGVMVDVTETRSLADAAVSQAVADVARLQGAAREEGQLHQVLDNLADGVYYVDRRRRITYWNRGAERLTGYDAAHVVGHYCFDNILAHVDATGTELCHNGCPLSASVADGVPREAEVWLRHADGSRRAVHVRTAPVRDASGAIIGGVEAFSDATGLIEARDAAEAARKEAFTDPLTGLPNRRLLDAVLAARKDDLDRHGTPFGLLVADVDHFKRFNDEHGHDVGDQALLVVASTLRAAVRGGDTVTRWGGEEFAIVAGQVETDGLVRLGDRILALVRAARVPTPSGDQPIRISMGMAFARPGEDLAGLFVRADQALLAAKQTGRDRFVIAVDVAEPA